MFLGRDLFEERNYSEQTAVLIDEEIRRFVDASYERAKRTLIEHRAQLDLLATTLLEKEVLDGEEVKRLVGPLVTAGSDGETRTGNNRPA
jgi:cell division protease FtsH